MNFSDKNRTEFIVPENFKELPQVIEREIVEKLPWAHIKEATERRKNTRVESLRKPFETVGGKIFELERFLEEQIQPWNLHYCKEFYTLLAKIYGVDPKVMNNYRKPRFVAIFKNRYIYSLFPKKVMSVVRDRHKAAKELGMEVKFFQFFKSFADDKLRVIIDEVLALLRRSNSEAEFIEYYSARFPQIRTSLF